MNNKIANEQGFNIIGVGIRTTNKKAIEEQSIQKLWQKFFEEHVLSRIPNKIDNSIIALYYDYENDKNGAYNLLVGARVSSIDDIPKDMIAQFVPSVKREIFVSDLNQPENRVFNLWKKIWLLEDEGKLKRAYNFDYELYDERNLNPDKPQMEIHIGVN